jgi:hypothetical protein
MPTRRNVAITEQRVFDNTQDTENSEYDVALPITAVEAVIDFNTNKKLSEILSGLNNGISGNAGTAAKLQTARAVKLSGKAVSDAANFDGSANLTLNVTAATDDTKLPLAGGTMTGTISTREINIQSGYTLKHNGTVIIDTSGIVARAKYNDLAEFFRRGEADLQPGDVLAYDWKTDTVVKADIKSGLAAVGVYSDTYGMILGGDERHSPDENLADYAPVAIAGRVFVKVTGDVCAGDYLTPGVGGVAQSPGSGITSQINIIGKALAPHGGGSIERIPMLVCL